MTLQRSELNSYLHFRSHERFLWCLCLTLFIEVFFVGVLIRCFSCLCFRFVFNLVR